MSMHTYLPSPSTSQNRHVLETIDQTTRRESMKRTVRGRALEYGWYGTRRMDTWSR
jgi:hypothetical protein